MRKKKLVFGNGEQKQKLFGIWRKKKQKFEEKEEVEYFNFVGIEAHLITHAI